MASNGIPFLSKILALAGIGVKNQTDNKEVLINVSASQPSGTTVSVDLPAASGTLAIKSEVVLASEKGVADGVATLDGSGKVPTSQLPPYSITDVFVVPNQAARLALTAQVGDVAVQTDTNTTYILQAEPASVNSNWVVISATNAVTAVNGQYGPGPVTITAADVGAVAKTGDTMSGVLTMGPVSTGSGETGQISFKELAANGAYSVTLRAPDALPDYVVLTLPTSHGSTGQVLSTDGTGALSWINNTAANAVVSVNGQSGPTVTLTAADVGAVAKTGDTMSGALIMGPTGVLSGQTGRLSIRELAANGTNSISLIAPDSIASDVTYVLPGVQGTSGQVLSTNGSGVLGWSSVQAPITGAATSITSADLTANRAVVSDGSGKIAVSSVTATELGYLSGVTSAVQTQIDSKQATITGAATTITSADLTASRAVVSDGSGKIAVSSVTSIELGYLSGVTSAVQTQINSKQNTITGAASTITSSNLDVLRVLISGATGKVEASGVLASQIDYLNGVTSDIQSQIDGKVSKSGDTMSGALVMGPIGTLSGQTGVIRLGELAANGSETISLRAPDALASSVTLTLPDSAGSAGQVLATNGSGALSWTDATDSALSARVDKLEASRGVYTGTLDTGTVLDISALVPTGAVEYPIVQVYKVEAGVSLQINVEFSFNPTTKQITFGGVADGPVSTVIHVLALTAPLTTL